MRPEVHRLHCVYFDEAFNTMTFSVSRNSLKTKLSEKSTKTHEKKLKLKALCGSYKLQGLAVKDKFLTPQNQRWLIFGASYLLAPRVHFVSTEG